MWIQTAMITWKHFHTDWTFYAILLSVFVTTSVVQLWMYEYAIVALASTLVMLEENIFVLWRVNDKLVDYNIGCRLFLGCF